MIKLYFIFFISISLTCSCQISSNSATVETNIHNADFKIFYTENTPSEYTKPFEDPWDNSTLNVDTVNVICDHNDLKNIHVKYNDLGQTALVLELNEAGTTKLSEATKKSIGKKLAIISKERIIIAPYVKEEIPEGLIQVSGHYTFEELEKLKGEIINNNQTAK